MANVSVVRCSRHKKISDKNSPTVYYIKQKAGDSKVYDIHRIASEIESVGALSVEDVAHVMKSFVRAMKKVLTDGNRVYNRQIKSAVFSKRLVQKNIIYMPEVNE
ncbi:hypothetical protein FOC69_05805 [Bacteroides fragilis]|uniref:Uncharacterized protein n=2 Tax=Bacteroides fragilis TaxID=817 RepID=A0AAP9NAE8_BACFG|nr:hypothetical protein BFAG_01428 [Bacteroides fragilis 3_1_12]MBM6511079.1 hypothetical protein [Bacteroides fragilis]QKH83893.1 hypothetical protein FOC69_05805 [Bacteroides fragilis]